MINVRLIRNFTTSVKSIKDIATYFRLLDVVSDLAQKGGLPTMVMPPRKRLVRVTKPEYLRTRDQIVNPSPFNRLSDTNRWTGRFLDDEQDGVAGSYWGEATAVSAEKVWYAVDKEPMHVKGYGSLPVLMTKGRPVLEPLAFMKDLVVVGDITRPIKMVDVSALCERISEYPTFGSLGVGGVERIVFHPGDYAGGRAIGTAITLCNRTTFSKHNRYDELYAGLVAKSARLPLGDKGNNVVFLEQPGLGLALPLEPKGVLSVRNTDTDGNLNLVFSRFDSTNMSQIVESAYQDHKEFWKE